jgi:hypothetical protein
MALLNITPKATDANSYVDLTTADSVLRARLYNEAWFDATGPTAEGYVTTASAATSATQVAVSAGTGAWKAGTEFKFAGHATVYKVANDVSGAGNLRFAPPLTANVASDEALVRLTPGEKERACLWATRMLDEHMEWFGSRRTREQALRFPRSGITDADGEFLDYDTIPLLLQRATAELALVFLQRNLFAQPDLLGLGISDATVGPLSVKIDSSQQEAVIPDNILAMLRPLGLLRGSSTKGGRVVPLGRV